MAVCVSQVVTPLTGNPVITPVNGANVVIAFTQESLILDMDVIRIAPHKVRLEWCGDPNKVAYVFLNGHIYEGPLFHDEEEKTFEVVVPELFFIEVHEHAVTVHMEDAISDPLERHPLIRWTKVSTAILYRIYRTPFSGAEEKVIGQQAILETTDVYEHQTALDQRQEEGQWNRYRVEAENDQEKESSGNGFWFFVPGLPKIPVGMTTVLDGGAPKITLEVD